MADLLEESDATISECGLYRYWLMRKWGRGPVMTFIMLNPSTADAFTDDRTIGRCKQFARREGCDAISVVNLFAYRATKPDDMTAAVDPVGPDNDRHIKDALWTAARHRWPVIAAWGSNKFASKRAAEVSTWSDNLLCLKKSQSGAPWHPLYIKGDAPLIPFNE